MDNDQSTIAIKKLVETMSTLRSPAGCPWDKDQTPESLKPYILEEAYELIEAIDSEETTEIRDELGDLLLQVIFLAQIYNEKNIFTLADVANSINSKLIRRHPHVFSDASTSDLDALWDEIKQQERTSKGKGNKLVDRIPGNLPALKQATKVAKKTKTANSELNIDKIHDLLDQLTITNDQVDQPPAAVDSILGDLLFGVVQLANSLHLDAEDLLRKKTMKVMTNFDK